MKPKPTTAEYRMRYAKAIEMYERGMSSTEISKVFGVDRTTILNWLKKAGIERRLGRQKYSFDFCNELGEKYENPFYSCRELAEEYGMSMGMVKKLAHRNGFQKNESGGKARVKVAMIDDEGRIIKIYPSIKSASQDTKAHETCISLCVNGKLMTAGGHRWKKLNELS